MSDDRDDFRRGRANATGDLADLMRRELAAVGIELADHVMNHDEPKNVPPVEVDRAAIRAYLEQLSCPEWAILSCPSLECARTFVPVRARRRAYPPSRKT